MHDAHDAMTSPRANDGARDLLLRLYREIGISAVAAALEASRLPDVKDEAKEQTAFPAVYRGDELAA